MMKRWIPFLLISFLVACGGESESLSTDEYASPTAAVKPQPLTTPTERVAFATEATPPLASTPTKPVLTPTPPVVAAPLTNTLPVEAHRVALGPSVSVCAGEGVSVGADGTVFTLGQRDGQSCASAIDLATGSVQPASLSGMPPVPDAVLEVSDPERERVYVAEGSLVIAYDSFDREIGTLFKPPSGMPGDSVVYTALRLDEAADRLYLSYQEYGGPNWVASLDLVTGETVAVAPALDGSWTLVAARGDPSTAAQSGRLVFADAHTLLILDGLTLQPISRLALSRLPLEAVADPKGMRLFVTDAGGDLHVLDAITIDELDQLPGVGTAVDLDPKLGRLYVGDRFSSGISVFDMATLELLGRIPQPGRPVASPADGQVYILEDGIYQADGATLQLVEGRTRRINGCDGCVYPTDIVVDPSSGHIFTTTTSFSGGKPGPTIQAAVDPLHGRAYVARATGGYQPVYSLALYNDLSLGDLMRWIDGLYGQPRYNPVDGRLYLALRDQLIVLDGQTLELLGSVMVGDGLALLAVNGSRDQVYAAQDGQLLSFEFSDATADASSPEPVEQLPGPVYGVVVSPNFSKDGMLLVRATDWETGFSDLYRSQDGGEYWVRLDGGLPAPPNDLVFAPDGKIYAAVSDIQWRTAAAGAVWGQGIYVSSDAGDTWRADNVGLTHLRVGRLHAAADGTLYALTVAAVEPGHAASGPAIWARPPQQEWTLVSVPGAGPLRLVDYAIPATYAQTVQTYWQKISGGDPLYQSWGGELRRSDDGGRTWRRVGRGPTEYAESVVAGSSSVYWVGPEALWRTTDEGASWQALRHSALNDAPPFVVTVQAIDGVETLFLGTERGQVLVIPVDKADWTEPG